MKISQDDFVTYVMNQVITDDPFKKQILNASVAFWSDSEMSRVWKLHGRISTKH